MLSRTISTSTSTSGPAWMFVVSSTTDDKDSGITASIPTLLISSVRSAFHKYVEYMLNHSIYKTMLSRTISTSTSTSGSAWMFVVSSATDDKGSISASITILLISSVRSAFHKYVEYIC